MIEEPIARPAVAPGAIGAPPAAAPTAARPGAFRLRLFAAMMLVVTGITALGLYVAQRQAAASAEAALQQQFRSALATVHSLQELRHAALAERCRILVRRPRIIAALEDNAMDVLYLTSADELRDLLDGAGGTELAQLGALHARFYRFLDSAGRVITPADPRDAGTLLPDEETRLSLPILPESLQLGYLVRRTAEGEVIDEIIAMPIVATESRETISALVVGFKPTAFGPAPAGPAIRSGIWLAGRLHLAGVRTATRLELTSLLSPAISSASNGEFSLPVAIDENPHLLFSKRLNPGSAFAPAFEICLYPLAGLVELQRRLRAQVLGAGCLLLLGALFASHLLSHRLAVPVEKLAVDSEADRTQRRRAEAELVSTHRELERAARFSADASHQLKTPVTVLRAGLEEFMARDELDAGMREEVEGLIHQTYRLGGVIEDLLLLSRMDAGRLRIQFSRVDLGEIIETWIDDLSALPNDLELTVTTDLEAVRLISGERRYVTLIVQNLLVNARKYNRFHGRVHVATRTEGARVILTIGNTGEAIPAAARDRIFERFHRGSAGENIPGHGLGLNLARDLARLHGGEIRLGRSADDWTEVEVVFRAAGPV